MNSSVANLDTDVPNEVLYFRFYAFHCIEDYYLYRENLFISLITLKTIMPYQQFLSNTC